MMCPNCGNSLLEKGFGISSVIYTCINCKKIYSRNRNGNLVEQLKIK